MPAFFPCCPRPVTLCRLLLACLASTPQTLRADACSLQPVRPAPSNCGRSVQHLHFIWPARGPMVFTCWRRDDPDITLALDVATPVKAIEAGVVSYAGDAMQGSGALIAIRHRFGFISLYAGVAALKV